MYLLAVSSLQGLALDLRCSVEPASQFQNVILATDIMSAASNSEGLKLNFCLALCCRREALVPLES